MTTAIIGTGGIGSAIARQLAAGGETLQLSSADKESARKLAAAIGGAAVVALDNRSALQGADAVVLALRFSVLKDVIDEIADALGDTTLVVPSNPVGTRRTRQGRAPPAGRAAIGRDCCRVVADRDTLCHGVWHHVGRSLRVLEPPVTRTSGSVLRHRRRPRWRRGRGADPNGWLRADEGRRDRTVEPTRGRWRPSRSRSRPRRGAVPDRWGLTALPPRPASPSAKLPPRWSKTTLRTVDSGAPTPTPPLEATETKPGVKS